jgi:hypothetical protein
MRKFACLLLCLGFLLGLALMNGSAAMAFDFLKSVENAAKSVEKKLDETFDKKNPGSDETHEEKIDQQKVANEAPKPAKRKTHQKGDSVVDSVKEQAGDMYKTGKGVFVKEEKKSPGAAKSTKAAKAPQKSAAQTKRRKAPASTPASVAKKPQTKAGGNPCGKGPKGMFGCYRFDVKDSDGKPIDRYVVDYKSLAGGGGGSHSGPGMWHLRPGKTQLVLKCRGKRKVFVFDVKPDQLIEREIVFPAVYKGKVSVAGSTTDGGFCVIYIRLNDPNTKKQMYFWSIKGRTESGYAESVVTGKYQVVAELEKTKQKIDLGIIEVKKGETVKKSVVFQRGTLSLTVNNSAGEAVASKVDIYDAKTNKHLLQRANARDPYVIELAPGNYIAKVSKYTGNENVPVKFTIKDKDAVVKEVALPN